MTAIDPGAALMHGFACLLVADFLSGVGHWLEDAYGRENWPLTGRLITQPNVLHHHDPRHFTRHSWLQSSWLLLLLAAGGVLIAWATNLLDWHVWLVAALLANANQIHKWAHRTPGRTAPSSPGCSGAVCCSPPPTTPGTTSRARTPTTAS